nr:ATP-binding cassette domain-containing protein [Candidatus Rhodoblastus alkanivorans]
MGERVVLSDVDLAIEQGEFIGVLGANGSGKTTLMRAILGLIPIQSGAIEVLGEPATRGNPNVGYMPQLRGELANFRFTGRDCVALAAGGSRWGLPGLNAQEMRDVDWALDMVGASELARRPLSEMSGGERQRLLLSQALLGHPRLLLLDEPLISLDPAHQKSVVEIVRKLQKELGLTVLFSAHELNALLNAIDRVLYLGRGKAVLGTVDEVVTGPVLSRLYGSEITVARFNGRIFVMASDIEMEHDAHRHDDHDHGHAGGERLHVRL